MQIFNPPPPLSLPTEKERYMKWGIRRIAIFAYTFGAQQSVILAGGFPSEIERNLYLMINLYHNVWYKSKATRQRTVNSAFAYMDI